MIRPSNPVLRYLDAFIRLYRQGCRFMLENIYTTGILGLGLVVCLVILATGCGSASGPEGTTDPTVEMVAQPSPSTTVVPTVLIPPVSVAADPVLDQILDDQADVYCNAADDPLYVMRSQLLDAQELGVDNMREILKRMKHQCPDLVRAMNAIADS